MLSHQARLASWQVSTSCPQMQWFEQWPPLKLHTYGERQGRYGVERPSRHPHRITKAFLVHLPAGGGDEVATACCWQPACMAWHTGTPIVTLFTSLDFTASSHTEKGRYGEKFGGDGQVGGPTDSTGRRPLGFQSR